jgi:maltose/moltooligosaccharide transporter
MMAAFHALDFIICTGAIILVGSILVSIFTTKEYSPDELLQFDENGTPGN